MKTWLSAVALGVLCSRALAQTSPPSLVGLSDAPTAVATKFDFVTPLCWTAILITAVAMVFVAWRWLMTRRVRSAGSSAVLVTMCRGLKLTAADKRTLKQLARNEGSITPVTMILCPSVFERAAARASNAVPKDAIHRLRQRLVA